MMLPQLIPMVILTSTQKEVTVVNMSHTTHIGYVGRTGTKNIGFSDGTKSAIVCAIPTQGPTNAPSPNDYKTTGLARKQ